MAESRASAHAKTVLITGGSTGIGYELAHIFAGDGYRVVLIARHAQKLAEVAKELEQRHQASVAVMAKDLALASSPDEIFAELQRQGMAVDVLVNNAGFGTHGEFAQVDLTSQLEMIQVNVTALTHLTRLFLPGMVARRDGRILNVASTAAFQPGPLMAVYYASKAFVLSFSEALANELDASGVRVTALCPGPTKTEFQTRAGVTETRLMGGHSMDAKTVALAGYRGMVVGAPVVIPGARNRLLALVVKFLPRRTVIKVVRRIQEKRR